MLLELHGVVELNAAEVGEHGELGRLKLGPPDDAGAQVLDERLGPDLLLDVDGVDRDGEVLAARFVVGVPDELGVEGGAARLELGLRRGLVFLDEAPQLLGGDAGALVGMGCRGDGYRGGGPGGLLAHR